MIIKVCGMREKANIQELIEQASPDLMGLLFYEPSSRFVEKANVVPDFYRRLFISKVGVFVNGEMEYLLQKINDFALDYVQLHGDETMEYIQKLKSHSSVKVIKVFRVGEVMDWTELKAYENDVDYFLFDTQTEKYGGSGKQFDWSILEKYPLEKGFLLSGGVDEESLDTIVALSAKVPQLMGVDINSKFELEPGLKDIGKVAEFVKEMRGKVTEA